MTTHPTPLTQLMQHRPVLLLISSPYRLPLAYKCSYLRATQNNEQFSKHHWFFHDRDSIGQLNDCNQQR